MLDMMSRSWMEETIMGGIQRLHLVLLGVLAVLLGGCNTYNLRYEAKPQPQGAHVFADFTQLQGAVGFPVDTDGRRLEEAYVRLGDGAIVRPLQIVYPGFGQDASLGAGIGFGHGGVGLGTGVGFPIGPERAQGLTTVTFEEAALGGPPWELHVKVQGISEVVIPGVGGPATAE
jgi:hypothetical protein